MWDDKVATYERTSMQETFTNQLNVISFLDFSSLVVKIWLFPFPSMQVALYIYKTLFRRKINANSYIRARSKQRLNQFQKAPQVLQCLQYNELKYTSSAQTGRENIQQEIQPWQNNTGSHSSDAIKHQNQRVEPHHAGSGWLGLPKM